jgi:hypothetical protein
MPSFHWHTQVAEGAYGVDITTYSKAVAAAEVLPEAITKQVRPVESA